ncbi:MAG: bifunctional DNA-formamidopyrimidine glycosylase/DNA-(apurinic or apyrimidinic site) lyase [Alphaproteobacteria bacterium]|nr:bifunctional DNA-formamidopyrimidine glycosylase/DNA-(apurinic or apyrimidinic site) lyase [Alphaproteobacteria bacterium]
MPELPEIETIKNGLSQKLNGALIKSIKVRRYDMRFPIPQNIIKLAGGKIVSFDRRAKYLLINVSGGQLSSKENTIISHLGMSGRITIFDTVPDEFEKHDHVIVETDKGTFVYNDARRFGMMDVAASDMLTQHKSLKNIGIEPLSDGFTGAYLLDVLGGRKSNIKQALLNQKLVAGIGNIYVCEALFRAKVSPLRAAGSLSGSEASLLVESLKNVLNEAIESGGSTLRDYKKSDGSFGYFQHKFAVYGKEGEKCPNCNCKSSIKRINQSGRSTFYCKNKQV